MCTFGLSGCRVKPRRPTRPGRRGSHTTARELQTCTFEGPGLQKHHQNSTRRPPRERRKNEISGGREKKARNFGPSHPSAPTLRAPFGPPFFLGSGPHPFGPPPLRAPTKNKKLAKCGLAKFGQQKLAKFGQLWPNVVLAKCGIGQMRLNKDGQIRFGQMRSLPGVLPFDETSE